MNIYIKKDDVLKMIEEITEKYLEGIYEEDDARYTLYELQEKLEAELESVEENENYHTIKIPERHGRLIDENELRNTIRDSCDTVLTYQLIDNCKTVIEAEG